MSHRNVNPNCPRPDAADYHAERFRVRDRFCAGSTQKHEQGKVWAVDLLWDDALRQRELLAGSRKSFTVRIENMKIPCPNDPPKKVDAIAAATVRAGAVVTHAPAARAKSFEQPSWTAEEVRHAALAAARQATPTHVVPPVSLPDTAFEDAANAEMEAIIAQNIITAQRRREEMRAQGMTDAAIDAAFAKELQDANDLAAEFADPEFDVGDLDAMIDDANAPSTR